MFVFLTSLRHPANANDFSKVEKLLSITLQSICGQTDEEFKVVVVCNELPSVEFKDPRVHYHVVDFPAPSQDKSANLTASPKFKDKGTKYMSGILYARQFNPEYLYIVDSDDWVHRDVVKVINSAQKYPVWYVNNGYIVNYPTKEYKRISGLSRYCGSTFVYDFNYLLDCAQIKGEINEMSSQDELIKQTSEFFILKLLSNHTINYRYFKSKGVTPRAIPLRAACWIQGTGENVSGTQGGAHGIPIDKAFKTTYSLPAAIQSDKKPNVLLYLRDMLTSMKSSYLWLLSRVTGENRF